jgi:actin-like ATPase involved in cell morphogenesis
MKYEYVGDSSLIVYQKGLAIVVNPKSVVELDEKPNDNFVEIIEKKKNEIKGKKINNIMEEEKNDSYKC